jgi:hypothetical protein
VIASAKRGGLRTLQVSEEARLRGDFVRLAYGLVSVICIDENSSGEDTKEHSVITRWRIASHVCQEIAAYTRACERLLSKEGTLETSSSMHAYPVSSGVSTQTKIPRVLPHAAD